jgi:RNA polymerase sigma-70 factor (ECF subfamily)
MEAVATETPIRELVEKARAGDRAAFDDLVRRFEERLRDQVRSRMGSRLRARTTPEDLVQDAFAVAFETIGKFTWRGEESFYRWLGSIAEHLIWSLSQKKAWGEISLTREIAGSGPSPSAHVRRDERFERLEKALESLSADHRRVVTLARLEGLKVKEIAARMGRSPAAVKKLLARALLRLRESFGDTESLHLPDRRLPSSGEADDE